MKDFKKQTTSTESASKKVTTLFGKENYILMAIGAFIIAVGMMVISGGKNQDPNVFDTNVVYSTGRITIAPILILIGFVIEIYAIFKKPKTIA